MSRWDFILSDQSGRDGITSRQRVIAWIKKAPAGHRVCLQEKKRSTEQNARLWATLTEVSRKALLGGKRYSSTQWKGIFMDALGLETEYLPKLEGEGFFPVGMRSSDLSVRECSDLIELIHAWCAKNDVPLTDPALEDRHLGRFRGQAGD